MVAFVTAQDKRVAKGSARKAPASQICLQYTPTRANSKIRIPCTNCVMSAGQAISWCQDIRKIEAKNVRI